MSQRYVNGRMVDIPDPNTAAVRQQFEDPKGGRMKEMTPELTERQLAELRRIVAEYCREPALKKMTAEPGLRVVYIRDRSL